MTYSYVNGVLTVTRDSDLAIVVLTKNPETQAPFFSEEDAMAYVRTTTLYFIPPPTLDELKVEKVNIAKSEYIKELYVDISYMSTTFQADKDSQNTIVSVLSAGSVPAGFFWVDTTNTQVLMTYAELQGLSAEILTRGQLAFMALQTKKADIALCTTPAELDLLGY